MTCANVLVASIIVLQLISETLPLGTVTSPAEGFTTAKFLSVSGYKLNSHILKTYTSVSDDDQCKLYCMQYIGCVSVNFKGSTCDLNSHIRATSVANFVSDGSYTYFEIIVSIIGLLVSVINHRIFLTFRKILHSCVQWRGGSEVAGEAAQLMAPPPPPSHTSFAFWSGKRIMS